MPIEKFHQAYLAELQQFFRENGHCYVPQVKEYQDLYDWIQRIKQSRPRLSEALTTALTQIHFDWTMHSSNDMRWLSTYYELVDFKKKHQTVRVTRQNHQGNDSLFNWVRVQRAKEKNMPPWRKKLLNEIGFLWRADIERLNKAERWQKWLLKYDQLKTFFEENGHSNYHRRLANLALAAWVKDQRSAFKRGRLKQKQIDLLNKLDFIWDVKDYNWQQQYEKLKAFKAKYGHCCLNRRNYSRSLEYWCSQQRKHQTNNKLEGWKVDLLNKIDFPWQPAYERLKEEKQLQEWLLTYQELKAFYNEHGHTKVRTSTNPKLVKWVAYQIQRYVQYIITPRQIELLNEINFSWENLPASWEEYFEELKLFIKKFNHQNIPNNVPCICLYKWTMKQRQWLKIKRLAPSRIKKLNKIGFDWTKQAWSREDEHRFWIENYEKLKSIFAEKGPHLIVNTGGDTLLSGWLSKLRWRYRQSKLEAEYIKLLNDIGFIWEKDLDKVWNRNFEQLKSFKAKNGHLRVNRKENPFLVNWTKRQLKEEKQGLLLPERKKKLDTLGFVWDPIKNRLTHFDYQWLEKYEWYKKNLAENVSIEDVPNTLRHWVYRQRQEKQKGNLPKYREKQLNTIGFIWKPSKEKQRAFLKERHNQAWLKQFEIYKNVYLVLKDTDNIDATLKKKMQRWIVKQRIKYKKGVLQDWRKEQLDIVGFDWESDEEKREKRWLETYDWYVRVFIKKEAIEIKDKFKKSLRIWSTLQRKMQKDHTLKLHRKKLLDEVGFKWKVTSADKQTKRLEATQSQWLERYEWYKAIYVEKKTLENEAVIKKILKEWITTQRRAYKNGKMPDFRKKMLKDIGFKWKISTAERKAKALEKTEQQWRKKYEWYKMIYVDKKEIEQKEEITIRAMLKNWIFQQRRNFTTGKIAPHRQKLLEAIHFKWRISPAESYAMKIERADKQWLKKIEDYKKVYVYQDKVALMDAKLTESVRKWVYRQRRKFNQQKLVSWQKKQLDEVGFEWKSAAEKFDQAWLEKYQWYKKIFVYKKPVKVGKQLKKSIQLWAIRQRKEQKAGKLAPKRKKMLDKVGFKWELSPAELSVELLKKTEQRWLENYRWYKILIIQEETVEVEEGFKRKMAKWAVLQRKTQRQGKLPSHRKKMLDELGFKWELTAADRNAAMIKAYDKQWLEKYQLYKSFIYFETSKITPLQKKTLKNWVATQRLNYKKGKLAIHRQTLLERLGFRWDVPYKHLP